MTSTPAKSRQILTIYGVSFGPTNPAVGPGNAAHGSRAEHLSSDGDPGNITLDATAVRYAGVSPGICGLYQINIQIPNSLADGNYPLVLTLGNFALRWVASLRYRI